MRVKKVWAVGLTAGALAASLLAGGCVKPTEQAAGPCKPAEKVSIGFSMDTLKEERWQRDKALVEQYAREAGAEIDTQVANSDDATQSKQAETLLTKGVNVLIVAPHNGVAAAAIVNMAKQRGVPVISYDRLIRNSEPDLYVSHQVEKMGEMQGQYALQRVPKGNYILIGGAETDNNALLLRKGQERVLKDAIDRKDINVVSDLYAKDWQPKEAQRITEDALTRAGGKIDAIVASNDGTAGGAIAGLPPNMVGKVLVTGQDAELAAIQRIVEGRQTMTIYKPIAPLAKSAVDSAVKLARCEKIDAPDRVNNGKIDVPSILHEPQTVDAANVLDTVVKDGYHKFEDVYVNVPADKRPAKPAGVAQGAKPGALFAALFLFFSAGLGLVVSRR